MTPTAGAWSSFDIDLSLYTVPDESAIIQIKIEGTPTAGTVCLDNIHFWRPAATGFDGVWASNCTKTSDPTWLSTEGGDAGTYIGDSVPTQYWWHDVAPGDTPPSFCFGYGINSASKPWGFGAFVKAPGNGSVDFTPAPPPRPPGGPRPRRRVFLGTRSPRSRGWSTAARRPAGRAPAT